MLVLGFEFVETLLVLFYKILNRCKILQNVGHFRRKIILICLHLQWDQIVESIYHLVNLILSMCHAYQLLSCLLNFITVGRDNRYQPLYLAQLV